MAPPDDDANRIRKALAAGEKKPTTEPIAPRTKNGAWALKPNDTRLMLRGDGEVELLKRTNHGTYAAKDGGQYDGRPVGRFWLNEKIRRGYVTVYTEGVPEPVESRVPGGFDAKTVAMTSGDYPLRVMGGALGRGFAFGWNWRTAIFATVGVVIVVSLVAFVLWRRSQLV